MVRSRILRWFLAFVPFLFLSLAAHADIKLKVNKTEVGQGSDFSEAMEAAGFSTEDAEKAKEVIEISIISGEFMDWESLSFFVNLTRLEILYNVECAAEEQEYFKGSKIEEVAIYSNIEISNKMFSGAKKLRTLKLEGATTVGESAFKNCKVLT
ncbi:MAG: leucine-rich repeat protein, partial [Bacteroides sp.]